MLLTCVEYHYNITFLDRQPPLAMSKRNGNAGADKLDNGPGERASGAAPPESGSGSKKRRPARSHKVTRHRLDEVEDEFEEFESAHGIESQMPAVDKVTIWLNSWMDEDDGDFGPNLTLNKNH